MWMEIFDIWKKIYLVTLEVVQWVEQLWLVAMTQLLHIAASDQNTAEQMFQSLYLLHL